MPDDTHSLRTQLKERQDNLHLIQERIAEYVQRSEVPLQLIKDERYLKGEIERLQRLLATEPTLSPASDASLPPGQYASGQNIAQATGGSTATVTTNQHIHNPASNQGAQGIFHGPVYFNQGGQSATPAPQPAPTPAVASGRNQRLWLRLWLAGFIVLLLFVLAIFWFASTFIYNIWMSRPV